MGHPWHHAISSAKRFGGRPEDYLAVHDWFDASKAYLADFRHRALRHHSLGVYWAERAFGVVLPTSSGREVPTRPVGERHCVEDLGFVPSLADWLRPLRLEGWMARGWNRGEASEEHPLVLARETARRYGGRPEDYLPLHRFLDETKAHFPDPRHRAMRHHGAGIREGVALFGETMVNADGEEVAVEKVLELHLLLELDRIPTVEDWLLRIRPAPWMLRGTDRSVARLSLKDLEEEAS